eukprot:SAG31_NODE_26419_length_442_cov_1.743440_2_plen_37_part_01
MKCLRVLDGGMWWTDGSERPTWCIAAEATKYHGVTVN